jgi:hypothetical protein
MKEVKKLSVIELFVSNEEVNYFKRKYDLRFINGIFVSIVTKQTKKWFNLPNDELIA